MKAAEIFSDFFTKEQDEVRRVRRGKPAYQIQTIARESWERLSVADRTALNIFYNSCEGRADKVSMLGPDMQDYFLAHSAETLLANPDVLTCIKIYLGETV
jgi:hypothetical protein